MTPPLENAALEKEKFLIALRVLTASIKHATEEAVAGALKIKASKAGFDPSQPRVQRGNPDGGEWTETGGGSGGSSGTGTSHTPSGDSSTRKPGVKPAYGEIPPRGRLRQPPDPGSGKRARAIYGETSGLTPSLKNPKAGSYNPSNHDPHSAEQLARARAYIGIVSERNPKVHFAKPPSSGNPIEASAWNHSVDAAIDGHKPEGLDPRVTNFFLRQEGIGRQVPPWTGMRRYLSLGPFSNVGGGDVPRGPKTYIDFYGEDK